MGYLKQSGRVVVVSVLALYALLACESKLTVPEGAPPQPAATTITDKETQNDPKTDETPDKKPKESDQPKSKTADTPSMPKSPTVVDQGEDVLPGPINSNKPSSYLSGITSYTDMNIPLPAGAQMMIKNLLISDSPLTQIGVSAHFRMQGGVFMSR